MNPLIEEAVKKLQEAQAAHDSASIRLHHAITLKKEATEDSAATQEALWAAQRHLIEVSKKP